ncbi:ATP-binding protein [Actinoplanes missouriensis]|uniref:ATP-binding protein n=1 Tax=Actinoplanes missouriensis TaxID=1866 RepID=UPI0033FA5B66
MNEDPIADPIADPARENTELLDSVPEAFLALDAAGIVRGFNLGLSRARAIVHLHRGAITLTPNTPTGTVLTVHLPATHP